MVAPFACGTHTAEIRTRGGTTVVGEATPLLRVRWGRIRDDISRAEIDVPTYQCCELLSVIGTVRHELHIYRNGEAVWQGVITRIEFDVEVVSIFAEDLLWAATRAIVEEGYNHNYPNVGNVIDTMQWLLDIQCFRKNFDPWRMTGVYGATNHLHPVHHTSHADDPREARVQFPYAATVWDEFDKFAEDYGADYTVVNRDIYFFDNHLAWKVVPDLDEQWISEFPRIVEYGNQLYTRAAVTNGKGYAGMAAAPADVRAVYGHVDLLISNVTESSILDGPPAPEDVTEWMRTAQRNLDGAYPPPVAVVVPANTTLLPGSPWTMADLFPGAWFQMTVDRHCRSVTDWQRIHEVRVEETAPQGEVINISLIAAPGSMVIPSDA